MAQIRTTRKRFHPETTVFHHSSKILPDLLEDVVHCYQKGKLVCKVCFYRRKLVRHVQYEDGYKFCHECKKFCDSVWLMPASHLCDNFGNFSEIPVPSMPRYSRHRDKPFSFCQKDDHFVCYDRSANSEIWFAHTIEELVVWTVEREYGCSFKKYIDKYYNPDQLISGKEIGGGGGGAVDRGDNKKTRSSKGHGRSNYTYSPVLKSSPLYDLDDFQDSSIAESGTIYDPEKVEIASIEDIPTHLLEDIARCYLQGLEVCKFCYFRRSEEVKKPLDSRGFSPACLRCRSHWQSVKLIPASPLCQNFGSLKKVPISIPANKSSHKAQTAHAYCYKSDHFKCFEQCYTQGFLYAHSVEELVVWTVERESGVGYGNFSQYIKDKNLVTANRQSHATPTKVEKDEAIYDPDMCHFTSISSIPPDLLSSVAKCYQERQTVCRACFFDSLSGIENTRRPTLSEKEEGSKMCERGHLWRPLRIIPASNLCTASYSTHVGIPPVPRHMQTSRSAFKVCSMADHHVCFEKTRENNPWFPHTVEEMVIWTVEREKGKDFGDVYHQYLKKEEEEEEDKKEDHTHTNGWTSHDHTPPSAPNDITSAVSSLAEGLRILNSSHSSKNDSTNSRDNEIAPLAFKDSLSSSSSGVNLLSTGGADEYSTAANNMATPLGGGTLTLDEASKFFPALVRPIGAPPLNSYYSPSVPSQPEVESPLSHVTGTANLLSNISTPLPNLNPLVSASLLPPAQMNTQPINSSTLIQQQQQTSSIASLSQPINPITQAHLAPLTLPPQSLTQMSQTLAFTPQPIATPIQQNLMAYSNPTEQRNIPETNAPVGNDYSDTTESEDNGEYNCYLCYREFESPREIAEHCMTEHHLMIVRRDSETSKLWQFLPPPPDQTPDVFKLCQRSTKCTGQLRCCKAHSTEELQEWSIRYQHRVNHQIILDRTPAQLVSMSNISRNYSTYRGISVGINPSHHTMIGIRNKISWTLDIKGQAWQTLVGVVCVAKSSITPLSIASIKGDSMYSIFPKSSEWVAPSFREGIFLGSVTVVVKTTPTVAGFNEHHVRLYLGSFEHVDIELKVLCQ